MQATIAKVRKLESVTYALPILKKIPKELVAMLKNPGKDRAR